MVTSTSRLSYDDCFTLFEQAIHDSHGTRIKFKDREAAWHFRIRFHTARAIDRRENKSIYTPGHRLYGCSIYDPIVIQLRTIKGETWLYLTKRDASHFEVENLSEVIEDEEEIITKPTPLHPMEPVLVAAGVTQISTFRRRI